MHQGEVSEDCLYLNIWTPAKDDVSGLPVLFYIHGGAFTEGSGSVEVYDGTALAKKGLVVVTFNYRMGVLGFLAHPELSAESDKGITGNYGMFDQIAALQWVQKNIEAFGGDPNNVTIAGQSAGAVSVFILSVSPLAENLYHRAIAQSGPGGLASFGVTSTSSAMAAALSDSEANGVRFVETKGSQSIEALRLMSASDLTSTDGSSVMRFFPVIDGHLLPDDITTLVLSGKQHDVPMLSGYNADEASAFPGYGTMSLRTYQQMASSRYGDDAEAYMTLYPAHSDDEAGPAMMTHQRDLAAVALSRMAAQRSQFSETDSYWYYFERAIPWPEHPQFGSFHSAEVPYVFNNLSTFDRPWEDIDHQLADIVSTYWVNFATNGDPNGEGLPEWPAYDQGKIEFLKLGDPVGATVMTEEANHRFFESFLDKSTSQ